MLPLSFILSYNNHTVLLENTKECFILISIIFIFIIIPYLLIKKLRTSPLDVMCFLYVITSCIIYLIVGEGLKARTSILLITSIFFLSFILSKFLSNYKSIKSSSIILVFLICCHSISLINFLALTDKNFKVVNIVSHQAKYIPPQKIFEKNNIEFNIKEKTIFFYIIMDGFPSIKKLDSVNFNTDKLIEILNKYNFHIGKKTFSDYTASEKSISSTLNFGKIKEPNKFVKKDFYHSISNSKFINFFKNIGAKIIWFPNILYMTECPKTYDVTCVRENDKIRIFNNEIVNNYIKYFLVRPFYVRFFLEKIKGKFNYAQNNLRVNLDVITDYLKKNDLDNNKSYLFFAHILSPHTPWRVTSNCELQTHLYLAADQADQAFLEQVNCNIIQIEKLLKIINEKVPNAYVFLHSDHGTAIFSEEEHDPMNFVSVSENLICENKNELDNKSNIEIFKKIIGCLNKKNN